MANREGFRVPGGEYRQVPIGGSRIREGSCI
jgi:hypothetical protein